MMTALTGLVGGWAPLLQFSLAAGALAFICLGIHGKRGETIWLSLVAVAWLASTTTLIQGTGSPCGPDDQASCSIR